jgi:flagellar hook assembly protein FlgD
MIRFETQSPGFLVNINIFDAGGNRIRNLAGNRLVSVEDGILWDGRDDNNRKAAIGIYIINIELFQPQGKASHFRKTVVLGGDR